MPSRRRVLTGVGVTAALAGCVENIDAELNPDDTPDEVFVVNTTFELAPVTRVNVTVQNPLETNKRVDLWARLYDDSGTEIETESVTFTAPSGSTNIVPIAFTLNSTVGSQVERAVAVITEVGSQPDFDDVSQSNVESGESGRSNSSS